MKNRVHNHFKYLATLISILALSLQTYSAVTFTESFTSPNFSTSSFYTGTFALSSGTWDAKNVMGLETINAYNGTGQGIKIERFLDSYITTPSLNSVGTFSFYYRNFSSLLGGGQFVVQKSVNNGAYTNLATVTFSSVSTYALYSITVNDPSSNIKFRIFCSAANGNSGYLCLDEFIVTDIGQTLAATPSSLSGIDYYVGQGPSASSIFNLFGSNLTGAPGNISITAPANYEVSSDDISFSNALNIAYSSSTLSALPIYVRLKSGLPLNNYNSEAISISGGGAPSFQVLCSGSVTVEPLPNLNVSPATLSGFTYAFGTGPSSIQSFTLIGTNLTGFPNNVVITAPADYELSTDYSNFYTSLNIPYTSNVLPSVLIYVRLKAGLGTNTYNSEIISCNVGSTTANVTCNGSVSPPPSALLSLNTNSLTGFIYIAGNGPSASKWYNLSGENLVGYASDIVVTAPINYEVSINNSTFTSSINVPFTSSTLIPKSIYVRLKAGLAAGTYNSELVANAGGGATTVNVACSGNVTAAPSPSLSVTPATLSAYTYVVGSGPSGVQSYSLSGSNLTGYTSGITITAPTDYEVSLASGSGYAASVNVACASATLASTPIYVRLKSGLAVGAYNSELIANAGGGATTVNVTCNGSVTDVVVGPCFAENFSGFTAGTHASPGSTDISTTLNSYTQTTGWTGSKVFPAGGEVKLGSSSAAGYLISPAIDLSAGGSISFDIQIFGTDAGKVQLFHAPDGVTFTQVGSDITPPAAYTTQTVQITGGTTLSKIKIGTSQKRVYLDSIRVTCDGSTPTPVLTVSSSTLSGFTYVAGSGPSTVQSYNISGANLNGSDVTITPSSNYEISLVSGSGFISTPLVLTAFNGASTAIYVRLKSGLAVGNYTSEIIANTGGGATTVNVTCSGSVTAAPVPVIVVNPTTLTGFTYVAGSGPSTVQSYNISGANLNGSDVTITPSANYEISLITGSGFISTPLVLTAFNGASTTIYVRLKSGLAVGNYTSEIIANTGGGATAVNVTCSGSVTAAPVPVIVVNPTTLTGFTVVAGSGPSTVQSYNISGSNLNGSDVTITPSANYEISLVSGSGFISTPLVLTAFNGASTAIYVRLKSGLAVGNYTSEIIANTGGGATAVNVTCSGSVTAAPVPVIVVNPTTLTGFTYVAGSGPSTVQSYNISGSNLNGSDVTITPSINYEISLVSGSGFISTPLVLTAFNGASIAIYVRLKSGLAVGSYNSEIIANVGGGATTVNVTCSGNVTAATIPVLEINPATLSGFTYVIGNGPSLIQSYNISGSDLTGYPSNITVTAPIDYEVSLNSGSGFVSVLNVAYTSATLISTPIYVRLKSGLAVGTYDSEVIANVGGGATAVNVTCNGSVTSDVSISESQENSLFNVSPNPFNDLLNIHLSGGNQECTLTLVDITGKSVIKTQIMNSDTYQLNTANIAPGVYVLRIIGNGISQTIKVVKR